MAYTDEIKLKQGQSITYVNLEKADNGGLVVRYNIVTERPTKSQSGWDDKTEVYSEDEIERAIMRVIDLLKIKVGLNK